MRANEDFADNEDFAKSENEDFAKSGYEDFATSDGFQISVITEFSLRG